MVVAAICPEQADERERAPGGLHQCAAAIPVSDIGGMGLDEQGLAIVFIQRISLAPFELLACIIAASAFVSVALNLRLSMVLALGLASCPARWRSATSSAYYFIKWDA